MSRPAGNAPKISGRTTTPERSTTPAADETLPDSLFEEAAVPLDASEIDVAGPIPGPVAANAQPGAPKLAPVIPVAAGAPRAMPARYTPESAAAAKAAAESAEAAGPGQLWPEGVPPREATLALLTASAEPPTELLSTTQALLGALTEAEFSALNDPAPVPEVLALREAVLTRWRLAAALAMKPSGVKAISAAALDQLLGEADASLGALKPPEGADEVLTAGYESARNALARDAVELSSAGQVLTQQAATSTAQTSTRKYKNVAARITNIEAVDAQQVKREANRTRNLVIGVVLSAIATVGYHGYRLFGSNAAQSTSNVVLQGLPSDMHGMKQPGSGLSIIRAQPGKPVDAAKRAELELKAQAEGGTLLEMSPGQFVIAPSTAEIPSDVKSGGK